MELANINGNNGAAATPTIIAFSRSSVNRRYELHWKMYIIRDVNGKSTRIHIVLRFVSKRAKWNYRKYIYIYISQNLENGRRQELIVSRGEGHTNV